MDLSSDIFQLATLLWEQGMFLSTTESDSRNISLYIYLDEYYFIWYSRENELETIEKTDGQKARLVFDDFFRSRGYLP